MPKVSDMLDLQGRISATARLATITTTLPFALRKEILTHGQKDNQESGRKKTAKAASRSRPNQGQSSAQALEGAGRACDG